MDSNYFDYSCAQCGVFGVKDGFCKECYKWYRDIDKKLFLATATGEIKHVRFFTLEEAREHVKNGGYIKYEIRRCWWDNIQRKIITGYNYSRTEIYGKGN